MDTTSFFTPTHPQEPVDRSSQTRDLASRTANLRARRWLHRRFIGEANSSASERAHPLYAFARYASPILVPALVGVLSLALALLLASWGMADIDLVMIGHLPLFVLLLLGGGAVFGYTIYFAEEETIWLATLVAGSGLFMAALLSAVTSVLLGLAIVAASAALTIFYAQPHSYKVSPATVAVTQLFKGYLRTLPPGLHILLPGEHIVETLETYERRFMSPTRSVEVETLNGSVYRVRAIAMITYAIDPALAYRTLPHLTTWERDLCMSVSETLRECLARWALAVMAGENPDQDALANAMLAALQDRAQTWGVRVRLLRVRKSPLEPVEAGDISWERPLDLYQTPNLYQMYQTPNLYQTPGRRITPVLYDTPTITNAPWPAHEKSADTPARARMGALEPDLPVPELYERDADEAGTIDAEAPAPVKITPDSLADAYQAIRERRIADPTTIRMIALAFANLAQDAALNEKAPYNATAAAQILQAYAMRLDQRSLHLASAS